MTNKPNKINILVAGGSGYWAESNHYPAILDLKANGLPLNVTGICDLRDPRKEQSRPFLHKIISSDKPLWINPSGKDRNQIMEQLDELHGKYKFDVIIVTTNPVWHFFYCLWAVKRGIHVLCDKPLVSVINSSFDVKMASLIQSNYERLKAAVYDMQKKDPRYTFCSPLRRRALTPFVTIADQLEDVYKKTGEGIRYMNIIVNGGVHKYPQEFLKGGAHGYLDGVGSLSHSSYHYIDVIAWYLSVAKGKTARIQINLPYVFRVKDYLKISGHRKLRDLIEDNKSHFNDNFELPAQVLNCELDFTFHIKLLDEDNNIIGLISYTSNHTTFTPRLTKYVPDMLEYTNDKDGGRMSHIYFDIQQGAFQSLQLIKNDVVFFGNNIDITGRRHPKLGKPFTRQRFDDAYDKGTVTPKDLFSNFLKHCAGLPVKTADMKLLSTFENQNLTNKLYSKFYEKIAEEFEINKSKSIPAYRKDSMIILDKYL